VTVASKPAFRVPGEQALVTKMRIVAGSVLLVGAFQSVCVARSWRSDNASPALLLLGAVCGIWYAILQLIHLRYFSRHRDLAKPKSLRNYYWPALILAVLSVLTGTFGLLPGVGEKIAEVLQACTVGLTLVWFHLAKRVRLNAAS
jgi:H+/Cl- antiporter ClcA